MQGDTQSTLDKLSGGEVKGIQIVTYLYAYFYLRMFSFALFNKVHIQMILSNTDRLLMKILCRNSLE